MSSDRLKRKATRKSKTEDGTHQRLGIETEQFTFRLPETSVAIIEVPMAEDDLPPEANLDTGPRELPTLPDSSDVDEAMDDDGQKPPNSPTQQAQPPLESWAAEVEDEIAKKARKQARKAIKRAKRLEMQGNKIEELRREGKPPPTPCPNCKGAHWAADCTRPSKRTAKDADLSQPSLWEKKSSKKRKEGETPAEDDRISIVSSLRRTSINPSISATKTASTAGMSSSTIPASRPTKGAKKPTPKVTRKHDIPTKRSQEETGTAEALYGDGLYMFLSTAKLGPTLPLPVLVNSLVKAGVSLEDFGHIEHHGKGYMIHMKGRTAVTSNSGRQIPLTSDFTSILRPYFTKGPQVFVATRSGDRPAHVLAMAIRRAFFDVQFWLAREEFRGKTGGGLLVIFDQPQNLNRFSLSIGSGSSKFNIDFATADAVGPCPRCALLPKEMARKPHTLTECEDFQPVILSGEKDLEGLLAVKPAHLQ